MKENNVSSKLIRETIFGKYQKSNEIIGNQTKSNGMKNQMESKIQMKQMKQNETKWNEIK